MLEFCNFRNLRPDPWFHPGRRTNAFKGFAVLFVLAICLGITKPSHAFAACTVTLKADGNTAALQHAMDRRDRPVICLHAGIYTGARLVATQSATVRGIDKERAILDAGNQGRILTMPQDGVDLTLDNVTLTHGTATTGGAILLSQRAHLTLHNAWLMGNRATAKGGGAIAASAGQLDLIAVRVTGNTAQGGVALDLTGTVQARLVSTLIVENLVQANVDGAVRVADNAHLQVTASTIAYNTGAAIVFEPHGVGLTQGRVESSILLGSPDAIRVNRLEAERVGISRSVVYGNIAFIPTDLQTIRALPEFNLVDVEKYRPQKGSPAIDRGSCDDRDAHRDLVGQPRPRTCTAGALEAPRADIAATRKMRKDQKSKGKKTDGSGW